MAAIAGASLGIALFIAIMSEGIGYMVLLIPRRIKELKDQGREGTRGTESQREWVAWNQRRMAALNVMGFLLTNRRPPDRTVGKT